MSKWFSKFRFRRFNQDVQMAEPQVRTDIIVLDNFVIEYLWKFNKLSNEKQIDEIVYIFNEMLSKNNTNLSHSTKMKLIIKLSKSIIENNKYDKDVDIKKCLKHLIPALYLICKQFEINFYSILVDIIFDPSIDAKERNMKNEIIPCNFASFADLITVERQYEVELDDILQYITEIWTDFFDYLMDFFDEESIETIKKYEILSDNDTMSKLLEEYIEEIECPSFETANLLIKFFSDEERTINIHYWVLSNILCNGSFANENEAFLHIVQQMADYAKYQSVEFEMKDNWKVIIHTIIHEFDGVTLNNIVNLLNKSFNISREEIEDYIENAMYDYLEILECMAVNTPLKKIEGIYRLLSNPIAFKVVSITDNDIIKLFE